MLKHLATYYKGLVILPLAAILVVTSVVVDVRLTCAHSPHDRIDGLDISPVYVHDETLFITMADHVFKSTDGGDSWKELANGLDNKYTYSTVVMSPVFDVDQTVFLSSTGDGVYRSQDGGASWTKIVAGLDRPDIGLLAISPAYGSDGTLLAAAADGGLYKTDDGGENWHEVIDADTTVTALAFSPDPDQALVVAGDQKGRLWTSGDNGDTWRIGYRLPEPDLITAIAISNQVSDDGTFFVGTEAHGLFKTVDGGAGFTQLNGPSGYSWDRQGWHVRIRPPDNHVMWIALAPDYGQNQTVFVSTWYEAVFKSDDGGQSWEKYEGGVSCDSQADSDEFNTAHFKQVKVSNDYEHDGTVFLAGFDGLFKSTDQGLAWSQLETLSVGLIKGLGISPAYDGDFSLTIATYGGGAYTTDSRARGWVINNSGLDNTRLVDAAFSPAFVTDKTVFSGARGTLLKSTDGGRHWEQFELDRIDDEEPYPVAIRLSPNFAADQTLFFSTRSHGLMKSVDGGQTASRIWDGHEKTIISLVVSPDFAADGTLFASLRDEGVYTSQDGGATWQPANQGLAFVDRWTSPAVGELIKKDTWLVISPNYEHDQTLFAGSPNGEGLFKTTDGGATWQKLTGTAYGGDGPVIALAISPDYAEDETVLVSFKGKGLYKTEDGGLTFADAGQSLRDQNQAIELIDFSPVYESDRTIYAASDEAIFQSTDGGQTWDLMEKPVRYEDYRDVVQYEGPWHKASGSQYSATGVTQTDVAASTARLNFYGSGVNWIGSTGRDQGIARVYIDGDYVAEVDQFSETEATLVTLLSRIDLADEAHTITIEVTDTKNPASTGRRVVIDAFDIIP